jgi:hypothetical protein
VLGVVGVVALAVATTMLSVVTMIVLARRPEGLEDE